MLSLDACTDFMSFNFKVQQIKQLSIIAATVQQVKCELFAGVCLCHVHVQVADIGNKHNRIQYRNLEGATEQGQHPDNVQQRLQCHSPLAPMLQAAKRLRLQASLLHVTCPSQPVTQFLHIHLQQYSQNQPCNLRSHPQVLLLHLNRSYDLVHSH